jgi:hypothetical protein
LHIYFVSSLLAEIDKYNESEGSELSLGDDVPPYVGCLSGMAVVSEVPDPGPSKLLKARIGQSDADDKGAWTSEAQTAWEDGCQLSASLKQKLPPVRVGQQAAAPTSPNQPQQQMLSDLRSALVASSQPNPKPIAVGNLQVASGGGGGKVSDAGCATISVTRVGWEL